MVIVPPDQGVFVEERYIRPEFYARLRQICTTRATVPHIYVAQSFGAYINYYRAHDEVALEDAREVFRLLNDDGQGLGAFNNTAAGYRLYNAGRIFARMGKLQADLLNVEAGAPVDMAVRFGRKFVDGQLSLPERPIPTENPQLNWAQDLRYIINVVGGLRDFISFQLEANAAWIYAPATKEQYDQLRDDLLALLNDCEDKCEAAGKIIDRYADFGLAAPPADMQCEQDAMMNEFARTRAESDILARYQELGGAAGLLGQSQEAVNEAGRSWRGTRGFYQGYEHGFIHWTERYGAHATWWGINDYYIGMGGSTSRLGFPASAELDAGISPQGTEGKFQRFEGSRDYGQDVLDLIGGVGCGATVYWAQAYGAHETWGGIGWHYELLHGTNSMLGFPTSDESEALPSPYGTTGYCQAFEGGWIHWSEQYGSHHTYGAINNYYTSRGGSGGELGFPLARNGEPAGEFDAVSSKPWDTVGRVQRFEGGSVYWCERYGAHAVIGQIEAAFEDLGGSGGELGFPKGDAIRSGNAVRQEFEAGWLYVPDAR